MPTRKLTKKELLQIINDGGWAARRIAQREKAKKNSERTKKWLLREANDENKKRLRHYLGPQNPELKENNVRRLFDLMNEP